MQIEQSLVDRMIALIQKMARERLSFGWSNANYAEAYEIADLLPKPVDPLLLQAREIADKFCVGEHYRSGDRDHFPMVQCALTALRARDAA